MLYMFDLDGTLISSYMDTESREINDWHVLPGRAEAIQALKEEGHGLAIITNQAGVAGESPFGTPPSEYAVFVGDMESDAQAARAAGVRYLDANEFFAVEV